MSAFPLFLDGQASHWYDRLQERVKTNWTLLENAFTSAYGKTSQQWLKQTLFLSKKQSTAQGVEDFAGDLQNLAADMNCPDDRLLYTFIQGLKASIRVQLLPHNPTSFTEAREKAMLIETALQSAQEKDTTDNNNSKTVTTNGQNTQQNKQNKSNFKPNFTQHQTPKKNYYRNNNNDGYYSSNNNGRGGDPRNRFDNRGNSGNNGSKVIVCFNCGKKGHKAVDCWADKNGSGNGTSREGYSN